MVYDFCLIARVNIQHLLKRLYRPRDTSCSRQTLYSYKLAYLRLPFIHLQTVDMTYNSVFSTLHTQG